MEVIFSLNDIGIAAQKIIDMGLNNKVVALHGDMGAGKTTLVHTICERLGVQGNTSSPTFSIINQYKTDKGSSIYHIDLYRLKGEAEAIQAGVEDCLFSGDICFVEWPDRAPGILPDETLHLKISIGENNSRKIEW
ncbi:tRNA (adenosine(37)-N6)-threonylcarbamoyltransferase complex ATPase subunit type 1 TsaE [Ferruginibacter sp. SUN002]|uniref:tRNA (adenosine(37)-N6)-threonylcarbamoyltransferase complex ATPase subunit type 1 TsaE n=1 Tax=Ferruginibacter sp. SUN002 TaxID=2937789 RepID=UPI003D36B0BF